MSLSLPDILLSPVAGPWGSGAAALLASLGLTPLVIRLARARGWVDYPSDDRWHDRPVALMGGIALAGAVALGVGVGRAPVLQTWPVLVGAGLMFVVGALDDRWGLRPDAKVLAQVLATVLLLYAGYAFWRGGPAWASMPLTFLWVIGVTNAFNLIDGIDGLAAGVAAVAAGAFVLVSMVLGQGGLAVVMAAVMGAALGFLAYNAPPARVFMGDCGSLFLGFLLAAGALGVQSGGEPVVGTLVPIAVLAVPIFDTTFVTVTRLLRGASVARGGTDHVHHRLVHLGLSERRAVSMLCGASALGGGAAVAALWMRPHLTLAVASLCLVAAVVMGGYLATTGRYALPEESVALPRLTQRVGAFMRTFVGGSAWKSVVGMGADLMVVGAAFVVAVHLRYGGAPPPDWTGLVIEVLPGVIGGKLFVLYAFRLYEGIWRHAGTPEGVRLGAGSVAASLLVGGGLVLATEVGFGALLPVLLIDWAVATMGIGGTRFAFRALRQYVAAHREEGRRVLLYGSDADAMLVLRHLRHDPELDRSVRGLLDDDPDRRGYRVQGVEVLGGLEDLPRLCSAHDIEEVILPALSPPEAERHRVQEQCAEAGVDCRYFSVSLRPASETDPLTVEPTSGNGAPEDPHLSSPERGSPDGTS
ncbi:MAG: hypothetical protein BRD28_02550 [Bacteroidetes bacterium QH_10_64_37]|jgi:UDP-GlcNAc:undecaprenyl-phosphate GlcNAc-1-phosphate transferase|nr:MAG: hypothetical protein BRD28_02550 [Bacteroidetes bacterium QH_10_64_37]